jgi:hypothetical protein
VSMDKLLHFCEDTFLDNVVTIYSAIRWWGEDRIDHPLANPAFGFILIEHSGIWLTTHFRKLVHH